MYFCSLRRRYSRYGQTTTRQIFDHIYATYANILPAGLQINEARMRSPYDVNHPVENLFDQVENSVGYASAGDTPYTPEQVVAIAFRLLFQTELFTDDCKTWKRKPPFDKTWANFKVYFETSHLEWRDTQVTSAGAGFQSDNHTYQKYTVNAISNLSTATASNRASVLALTATNRTLTAKVDASHANHITALLEITKLASTIAEL